MPSYTTHIVCYTVSVFVSVYVRMHDKAFFSCKTAERGREKSKKHLGWRTNRLGVLVHDISLKFVAYVKKWLNRLEQCKILLYTLNFYTEMNSLQRKQTRCCARRTQSCSHGVLNFDCVNMRQIT